MDHAPPASVYINITHMDTGEVLGRLGPYPTAAAARAAAGVEAGQVLTWSRDPETWRAEKYPHAYHVPADPPLDQD